MLSLHLLLGLPSPLLLSVFLTKKRVYVHVFSLVRATSPSHLILLDLINLIIIFSCDGHGSPPPWSTDPPRPGPHLLEAQYNNAPIHQTTSLPVFNAFYQPMYLFILRQIPFWGYLKQSNIIYSPRRYPYCDVVVGLV
jgi:hypothetical protein